MGTWAIWPWTATSASTQSPGRSREYWPSELYATTSKYEFRSSFEYAHPPRFIWRATRIPTWPSSSQSHITLSTTFPFTRKVVSNVNLAWALATGRETRGALKG